MVAKLRSIVREEVDRLPEQDRKLVLVWAQNVQSVRNDSKLSQRKKLLALVEISKEEAPKILLRNILQTAKRVLWTDRSWPARFALSGAVVGLGVFGSKAAGIATMGSGVAVSTFLLTSAGGALVGVLVEELQKATSKPQGSPDR